MKHKDHMMPDMPMMPGSHMDAEHYHADIFDMENDMGGPKKGLSRDKAAEILHDGTAHGKPLTARQRRYMGAVASGKARK